MDATKLRALRNNEEIFLFVRRNARRLFLGDQDTVNAFYDGCILCVDTLRYNLDEGVFRRHSRRGTIDENWVRENTVILHYAGPHKPWDPPYRGKLGAFFDDVSRKLEASAGETV
jgi:lipopolysaccharide biosynthesis glycosyltransferase